MIQLPISALPTPFSAKALDKKFGYPSPIYIEAMKLDGKAEQVTATWTKAHSDAVKAGNHEAAWEASEHLLFDPLCLFTAAWAANESLPSWRMAELSTCLMVANLINLKKPLPEVQRGVIIPKSKGGYRAIIDPGLLMRTAGVAITRVLTPHVKPRNWQFTLKGQTKAITAIRAKVEASLKGPAPMVYAAHLDISSFYPSHDPDWLVNRLPLRKDVAAHGVVGRHLEVKVDATPEMKSIIYQDDTTIQNLNTLARKGLPQGLATSSLIAVMTLARLKWHEMPGVMMANFGDDFFLLAMSEKALTMAVTRLQKAVAVLPGGHFDLNLKRIGPLSKGIDFIGHSLRMENGELRIRPTEKNLASIRAKLMAIETSIYGKFGIAEAKSAHQAHVLAAHYVQTVQGWLAAHKACDDLETRWAHEIIAQMHENLAVLNVSLVDAKEFISPWMDWKHIHS